MSKTTKAGLTREFVRGFSKSNLEYMRGFHLAHEDREFHIAQTTSGQLSALIIIQTATGQSAAGKKVHTPSAESSAAEVLGNIRGCCEGGSGYA
jgi:hypothetical protein